MIGIYKITNPIGKVYIAQSKNIKNRWACHKYNVNKNIKIWGKLYDSFLQFGFDKHKFEILEICKTENLDLLERYYQEKYNSFNNGLNSVLHKSNFEKVKFSKEAKLKMSKIAKGKIFSQNHIEKIRENSIGSKNPNAKIVLDVENGIFYETSKEASKIFNISQSKLSSMLNGHKKNNTNLIYV